MWKVQTRDYRFTAVHAVQRSCGNIFAYSIQHVAVPGHDSVQHFPFTFHPKHKVSYCALKQTSMRAEKAEKQKTQVRKNIGWNIFRAQAFALMQGWTNHPLYFNLAHRIRDSCIVLYSAIGLLSGTLTDTVSWIYPAHSRQFRSLAGARGSLAHSGALGVLLKLQATMIYSILLDHFAFLIHCWKTR